jgi:enoyl-CoA hydratase/carnithine racemase
LKNCGRRESWDRRTLGTREEFRHENPDEKRRRGSMGEEMILKRREGDLAFVVFNRPDKLNAMNGEMLEMLPRIMKDLEKEEGVRVIIFRGSGERAFSAGGDINEFREHARSREKAEQAHEKLLAAIETVYRTEIPTIAMVNGPAVGVGCEISMACDIRIASEDASFGITGSRLGFPIPYRNALRLVSLVGPSNAKKMLYTGELVPAGEAFRMGLATRVLPKAELEAKTLELAHEIAQRAPLALRAIKRTVNEIVQDPGLQSVDHLARWFVECFLSKDFQEGVSAFLEKRPPVFQGQ